MPIKVFLADDHQLMVAGFRLTLKHHAIDVVDVAYSLEGLYDKFIASNADVLVVDVRFEGTDEASGLCACEQIRARKPNAKIVVFSQFDDEWIVQKAYKLGALAFVRKDEDTSVLVQAISMAHQGKQFFSPVAAQLLAFTTVRTSDPTRVLNEKELKLFTLIADGYSMAETGEVMNISYRTVREIVKIVREKLELGDSFADFTKMAIKFGLTDLELKKKN